MIYPDVSLEEWLEKYPDLEVLSRKCDHCGRTITANIPYISKDFVGLTAPRCLCGKNRFTCGSALTRTKESFNEIHEALSMSFKEGR